MFAFRHFIFHVAAVLLLCLPLSFLHAQDTQVSEGDVFDGEPFLSIDPADPQHLVIAWMGFDGFDLVQIKIRVSTNGGSTWSAPIGIPHLVAGYTSADPSLAWDSESNLYLSYIDSHPAGTNGKVLVRKSADGGLTWGAAVEAIDAWDDGMEIPVDRPWMVVDRSGGPLDGYVYITTKPAPWIPFPNRNYLVVSSDGDSFSDWRYIDTLGWQIGDFIQAPMAAPAMGPDGRLHVAYPAWEWTENLLPRFVHASSINAGASFSYHEMQESDGSNLSNDTTSKKGYQLLVDPTDANHLVFLWLFAPDGDNDIYLIESLNGGVNWTPPLRLNDDPAGSGVMQDLVWGDFDSDGDLAVCWRDRRNAVDTGYAVSSEIWGVVKGHDSLSFGANFRVSASSAFDSVLYGNGNDFMALQFENDTLYAAWGDARDGVLTVWFNKLSAFDVGSGILQLLSAETPLELTLWPNPATDQFTVAGDPCSAYYAINNLGERVLLKNAGSPGSFETSNLSEGTWFIIGEHEGKSYSGRLIVFHK